MPFEANNKAVKIKSGESFSVKIQYPPTKSLLGHCPVCQGRAIMSPRDNDKRFYCVSAGCKTYWEEQVEGDQIIIVGGKYE